MSFLLAPEVVLVDRIAASPSPGLLRQLFSARTSRWRYWYFTGEFSSGLFSDLEEKLSPETAFRLIPSSLDITLEQEDPVLFTTALSLLLGLAKASETTEMPTSLQHFWNELASRAAAFSQEDDCKLLWDALADWYRR